MKDWDLLQAALENDFILATNNSQDFRGPTGGPIGGLHATVDLHPGLLCINAEMGLSRSLQQDLFAQALQRMPKDMTNWALEAWSLKDGRVSFSEYEIPVPCGGSEIAE